MDTRRIKRSTQQHTHDGSEGLQLQLQASELTVIEVDSSEKVSHESDQEVKMAESNALLAALQSLRAPIGELPTFSGNGSGLLPEEFISKFNRHALINDWSDAKKLLIASIQLKDAADTWFEGLPETDVAKQTWQGFRDALIDRFHDKK